MDKKIVINRKKASVLACIKTPLNHCTVGCYFKNG